MMKPWSALVIKVNANRDRMKMRMRMSSDLANNYVNSISRMDEIIDDDITSRIERPFDLVTRMRVTFSDHDKW